MKIYVRTLGIGTPHSPEWIVDGPNGGDEYVTMCFQTPFFVLTEDGEQVGGPGDCIIVSPDFPRYHGTPPGEKEGFRNDWLHIGGEDFPAMIERYGLPMNRIIPAFDGLLIRPFITQIHRERLERGHLWRESLQQQVDLMHLNISRAHHDGQLRREDTAGRQHRERLVEVRTAMHSDIRRSWRIDEMARMAHLSSNRFAVLYRKTFGISPIEDLIQTRLTEAKRLLVVMNSSIAEVAQECGFANIYYFSKVFKERTGLPPSKFRSAGRG